MTRNFRKTLLALALAPLAWGAPPGITAHAYEGTACLPDDTVPLYRESYAVRMRDGRPLHARTEYRDADGTLIAERTLDFSRDAWRPAYRFRDARTGYEERAELRDDGLHVFRRNGAGAPPHEKVLRVPEPFVVDGGFTRFLADHWDSLSAGETVRFQFVAVSRLDWLAFEAYREPPEKGDSENAVLFTARPRNPALKLLVEPIRFRYDLRTRRLTEYLGTSNIRDAEGRTPKVRLTFTPLRPAP